MRKLIFFYCFISFFFAAKISAQEKQIEIYDYVDGVKQISPTFIISEDNTKIFNATNGVKNISPSLIIKEDKVYEVENGVQQLFPKLEVRIDVPNVHRADNIGDIFIKGVN